MSNVFGDAENNILGGTSNDDLINGYGGDDQLSGGGGNDLLNADDGADTLKGGGGIDTLNGDAGEDNLKGGGGNDTLNGGADNDTLAGGKGSDTLDGGEGNDRYEVTAKDFGTTDTFDDSGTGGEDEIDADKVLQLMLGGDFNALDTGIESIRGDVEDQLEIIGDGHAVNWDFTGIDLVNVSQILGSGENDVITGSDGDDKVKGGGGDDELNGGDGDDNLAGGGADDTLAGGDDDDKLKGGGADDTLMGGAGNDTLTGGGGNDVMDGGEGGDTYVYKAGESAAGDEIADSGTSGTDVLDVSALASIQLSDDWNNSDDEIVIIEEFRGNADTGTEIVAGEHAVDWSFEGATMVDITKIVGSSEGDNIGGSESDDVIQGGGGGDGLSGGNGDDNVKGGGGDDTLFGGAGNDTLKGGGGDDTLVYDAADGNVDGQADEDTLWLLGSGTLDITELAGTTLKNLEVIDLFDLGNTLVLDKASVQALSTTSETLTVNGGESDIVMSTFEWTTTDIPVEGYHIFTSGAVTLRVQEGVETSLINTEADDNPVLTVNAGAQVDEGGFVVLTTAMLNLTDIDSLPAVLTYSLLSLPDNGQLELINDPGNAIVSFTQVQLEAGEVKYVQTVADAFFDTFIFVFDDATFSLNSDEFVITINADVTGTGEADVISSGNGDDTLSGAGGDDILNGDQGTDTLHGGADNDFLGGGYGDDILNGDNGDDMLHGGFGDDTLDGGDGSDTADYNNEGIGSVTVNLAEGTATGGQGDDTLTGIENVIGTSGDDVLTGDDNANELDGGEGNDTLTGGDGDDTYIIRNSGDTVIEDADEGTDLVNLYVPGISAGNYMLAANMENATLIGYGDLDVTGNDLDNVIDVEYGDGANVLDGAGGADTLLGGAGNDTLKGGTGNDDMTGGAGNDTLEGGDGDDVYNIDDDDDTVVENADEGQDLLKLGVVGILAGAYTMDANVDNAMLIGNGDFDVTGNGLDNMIDAESESGGVNVLDGAGGDDQLDAGSGNDTLMGGTGDDLLNGGGGNDALTSGHDVLDGGAGNDTLNGGAGNDVLIGGADNDTLNGGFGTDTADYSAATEAITVNLADTNPQDTGGAGTDTLSDIENVIGGAGNDVLTGDGGANVLSGGGDDDTLDGGSGDDILIGGAGDDIFYGGANVDTVSYINAGGAVVVNLASETGTGEGSDQLFDVENITGSAFNDDIQGNNFQNVIEGGGGSDTLNGNGGDDIVYGGEGSDNLSGAEGNDTLHGGSGVDIFGGQDGDDVIYGGDDNDIMFGGGGNDILFGDAGDDEFTFNTLSVDATTEAIGDFEGAGAAGGDVIVFFNSTFTGLGGAGTLSADEFEKGDGLIAAATAEGRIIYDTTTGALYYDVDGVGGDAAVKITTISGDPGDALDAGDIMIS